MPWFEYEGLTPGGTTIAGRVEAGDWQQASDDLAQMQIQVNELREAEAPPTPPARLTEDDLIFFNEQLASLAQAGIALDEGLAQLARDVDSPRLRRWIDDLVNDIRRGIPIEQAMETRERGLPILYSRVIRAGIDSGQLPATLLNLNQHLRLAGTTRRMLWEIASYPLLVLLLAVTIASLFFTSVVPHMKTIFEDFGTQLPDLTLLILSISDHYPTIMLACIAAMVGMSALWRMLRWSAWGRSIRESILMAIPVVGVVYRASLIARFFRSVSTAVATGIALPQALRLAADATGSVTVIDDADRLAKEVEQGQSIFVANQTAQMIPPLFGYCVQIASGRQELPTAIGKLARSYENRAIHSQAMLRGVLFPAMIVVVGGGVAIGVVALFLPLITLINSVSG